jgi:hypothetical protein
MNKFIVMLLASLTASWGAVAPNSGDINRLHGNTNVPTNLRGNASERTRYSRTDRRLSEKKENCFITETPGISETEHKNIYVAHGTHVTFLHFADFGQEVVGSTFYAGPKVINNITE